MICQDGLAADIALHNACTLSREEVPQRWYRCLSSRIIISPNKEDIVCLASTLRWVARGLLVLVRKPGRWFNQDNVLMASDSGLDSSYADCDWRYLVNEVWRLGVQQNGIYQLIDRTWLN